MSQNLRNYTKALYGFDAVVQRVPADQWDAPSPCEGWSARDVLVHQVGVINAVAQMARTGAVAWPDSAGPGDDPVGLWNACRDRFFDSVDRPDTITRVGSYWFGESPFDEVLAFAQWDPLVSRVGCRTGSRDRAVLQRRGRCRLARHDRVDGRDVAWDGSDGRCG